MTGDRLPYGGEVPRESGSETSAAAAGSVQGIRTHLQAEVFAVIERAGDLGATDDEIERALGMRHQTASARRRELVLLDVVMDSGLRRKTTSGRTAVVWVVR